MIECDVSNKKGFGDIVTMSWWDDLWLNEGFASFVEHIGTNYSHPEFNIWDFFLIYMNSVLVTDSSFYTHPIELTVNDPNEIDTLFDSVTYDKGMSVIRMLYQFMGSNEFMNGIQSYLTSHVYQNANTQQLWYALGGDDIINMMNTWVLTPGYPILNVSIINLKDENGQIVFNVNQKRMIKQGPSFYDNPQYFNNKYSLKYDLNLVNEYSEQLWEIPLEIELIDGSVEYKDNVMKDESVIMKVDRNKHNDDYEYYMFNKNMNGFFRVLYDEQLFDFLIESWLNGYLSDFDKFSILSDQYAFMLSNYISTTKYLEFLYKISIKEANEPSYLMWDIIIDSLLTIDSLFCEKHLNDTQNAIINFRSFAQNILSLPWIAINKWNITDTDSEDVINLRALLIYSLVRFNDEEIINYGYNMITNTIISNDGKVIINDNGEIEGIDTNILRQVIECALTYQTINDNSQNILTQFISIYPSLNSEYQTYVLRAIGAVYSDLDLHSQALEFILSSGNVRDQDKLRGLYSLRRCYGREKTWNYLLDNGYWEQLFNIYGSGFSAQDITEIPNSFASITFYENVYEFYYKQDGHKTSSNERSVNETLENIQVNIEWLDNNYNDISQYLIDVLNSNNNDDDEKSEYSLYNYIWIVVLILMFVLCLTIGFRWIWKRKLSKTRMFADYKRQIDINDNESDTKAMITDDTKNEYNITMNMNSIDDDQYHQDDVNL